MTDGEDSPTGGLFSRELEPPPQQSKVMRIIVIGVIGLLAIGVWMWVHGSAGGGLRAMSPAQREAFFEEAWAAQRALCLEVDGPRDSEARCRKRAEYLLQFPQCDEVCRKALAPSLQGATP